LRRGRGHLHRRPLLHPPVRLPDPDGEGQHRSAAPGAGGPREQRLRRLRPVRRGRDGGRPLPVLPPCGDREQPRPVGSPGRPGEPFRARAAGEMSGVVPVPGSGAPLAFLVAALGGEGGGVLAEWLVQCGIRAGLPIQATSVPGVAQRTGSTSYYIELMSQPLPPGSPRPVFALSPVPGRVDVLVASEAVEAGRMMERGFVRPDRTLLIASTHRVYTTAEKMHMADGRYETGRVVAAGRQLARQAVFMDMEAIAARHGTVLSAVMFGALSGAGALPWPRGDCEAAIRESGRGVAASLAGFDEAWRHAAAAVGSGSMPEVAADAPRPAPDALRVLQTAGLAEARFRDWSAAIGALPLAMQSSAAHGALRCRDYQDDAQD